MAIFTTFGMRFGRGLALVGILGSGCLPVGARQSVNSNAEANSAPSSSSADNAASPASRRTGSVASSNASADAVNVGIDVYRIGVEDELQISVWREPELSSTVVVRPDGMITIPLLNDIQVVGLRPLDLQALLTEKLKPLVNEPQVTVIVRQIHSRRVYVFGHVAHQGTLQLNTGKTVLEVLAEAGGITEFGKPGAIYILRTQGGKRVRIPIDYKKVVAGQSQNLLLQPGDVVVVP